MRRRLGRFGEALAADFLAARGAHILGRNVRAGRGELDLVVTWTGAPVAVEVKAAALGAPNAGAARHFTEEKLDAVVATMRRLRPRPRRLDLIEVGVGPRGVTVRWVKDVA